MPQDSPIEGESSLVSPRKWDLANLPDENTAPEERAKAFWDFFDIARRECDRLEIPDRVKANYALYRGDHWQHPKGARGRHKTTINLFFANVQRTVANLTARDPLAEVVDLDGISSEQVLYDETGAPQKHPETGEEMRVDGDGADAIISARTKKWWKDTEQRRKLSTSVLKMEKYGVTIEKGIWELEFSEYFDPDGARMPTGRGQPKVIIVDGLAFFPAPGNWTDVSLEAPYVCHAYPMATELIEKKYNLKPGTVKEDRFYSLLGEDREQNRPTPAGMVRGAARVDAAYSETGQAWPTTDEEGGAPRQPRALVVEIWIRDHSTVSEEVEYENPRSGAITLEKRKRLKYPGGIRMVQLTNNGELLLADVANPSINPNLPREAVRNCWLYKRFPFWKANSYEDTTNIWGFSAAEQVADLNYRIDEIFSKIAAYVLRVMFPPLVIPNNIGIDRSMINNKPNLVLMPNAPVAPGTIHFVDVPNLPRDFFNVLGLFVDFFDRVYQIEDADRGQAPKGVTAASAIVALQERNAMLMQHKIKSVDYLTVNRGKAAISLWQNFGFKSENISVKGNTKEFIGTRYIGRNFNYTVEAGSTTPKTSLQVQELAERYYQLGAVDRQALLENSDFPGWKEILERTGEGMVAQALQILIQAGLDPEAAKIIYEEVMATQGGPGNVKDGGNGGGPQGGSRRVPPPKSKQGARPPGSAAQFRGAGPMA